MEKKLVFTSDKLLLVEGNDDSGFFEKLLKHIGLDNIQVHPVGGKSKYKKEYLEATFKTPGFENVQSLGIVKDADDNAETAFSGLCTTLTLLNQFNLSIPKKPMQFSNRSNEKRKMGILIIPPHRKEGMLEDLCLSLIEDYEEMECLDEYFNCLNNKLTPGNYPNNLSKSKLQAFLASRKESVPHLGIAAQKGHFPLNKEILTDIKTFLQQL